MLKLQLWLTKVMLEHPNQLKKIRFEPSVAMIKDLLVNNIDGHVIYFCDETYRIAKT